MNEGCSDIKKNKILEPKHLLRMSHNFRHYVMPKIVIHSFSSKGTSNNPQTRNMQEQVSITTVKTKNDLKTKLKDIR